MSGNFSLHINDSVLNSAQVYARLKGVSLSAVIEDFLAKWTREQSLEEKIANFPISNQVNSLAGRIKVDHQSVDWEKQRKEYLNEKYAL